MAFVTIPMALLTLASIGGALVLITTGAVQLILPALLGLAFGLVLVYGVDRMTVRFDSVAVNLVSTGRTAPGRLIGLASGALPVAAILAWLYLCLRVAVAAGDAGHVLVVWLTSYGVATGPWSLHALWAGSDRRTVCGIRAYAGHLAYWTLSLLVLGFGVSMPIATVAMAWPTILPLVVGALLATADRDALRNVRI
jgi:hypothetical protein